MKDLFETPEKLPKHINAILDRYNCESLSYSECKKMLFEFKKEGFIFDFGLDAIPYNLRICEISTINGHLTSTNKNHIKQMFYTGLKTAKVNRITYNLIKESENFKVTILKTDNSIVIGQKIQVSKAIFKLI